MRAITNFEFPYSIPFPSEPIGIAKSKNFSLSRVSLSVSAKSRKTHVKRTECKLQQRHVQSSRQSSHSRRHAARQAAPGDPVPPARRRGRAGRPHWQWHSPLR